jgi:hypothetical protein
MRGVPRISHLFNYAEGGVATVIAALRLCDDPDAQKFLDKFDSLSETDKGYVGVEEISVAAGVAPKRLLELAVSSLVEDSRSAGAIIAASFHPKVIRATAEGALHDDAWYDEEGKLHSNDTASSRKLFLSGTGFLPQPANRPGGVFVNITTGGLPPVPETRGELEGEVVDSGPAFNAAEDDLKRVAEVLDGSRMLEAPKQVENAASIRIGHQYHDSEELECIPTKKSSNA